MMHLEVVVPGPGVDVVSHHMHALFSKDLSHRGEDLEAIGFKFKKCSLLK